MSVNLDVDRDRLATTRLHRSEPGPLNDGEVRLAIDSFALTTNNITYAVFGDGLRYWDFFPVGEGSWGRVPVWGFGEAVESRHGEVTVGERFYGYLPMATHLVVVPGRVDRRGFTDLAPHRAPMAAAYNRYLNVATDPIHRSDDEDHQMVLWPLFMTSFMIDDYLGQHVLADSSVATVVVSSASSKTAIGAARLASRRSGVRVVGLTSPGNRSFVESLGCYDAVVDYGAVGELPDGRATYVDIAGDRGVTARVHEHYGEALAHSMVVGSTHWDAPADQRPLVGPKPEFFFAPAQIAARTKEWGRDGLDERVGTAWREFSDWCRTWLRIERTLTATGVEHLYGELLAGRVDPRLGHVCRMGE